ncbi:MAG: cyanophycinase [Candidatus Rokuibacteriota bacterium]
MAGTLLLAGGAEFGGQMMAPDREAIERAGGLAAPIRIIPAAAAPDHNHQRAGRNGENWFRSLSARDVAVVPVIDRASAEDERLASELRRARLIYLLGGFTQYLGQTIAGSACAHAMGAAYEAGAVLAGSSAGAMVLCEHYYDPSEERVHRGLGYLANACLLPHYSTFGQRWVTRLVALLPSVSLVGIDEETGMMVDEADGRRWRVYGRGQVTLHRRGHTHAFPEGATFTL